MISEKNTLCNMFFILKDCLSGGFDKTVAMKSQNENYQKLFSQKTDENELVFARCIISATRALFDDTEQTPCLPEINNTLSGLEKVVLNNKISKKEIKSVISGAITSFGRMQNDRITDSMLCLFMSAADVYLSNA